jgi:predicted RecA/RadA family phage recombinase
MKNKQSDGRTLTLIAPYDVASGAGLKVGGIFAVAICAALLGEAVAAKREGAVALAALSSDTASVGDPAYWDDDARRITTTSTGNTLVGSFYVAKLGSETTATVLLADPAQSASPDILTRAVNVTSAELLALFTTPKTLVSAPGAGLAIVPVDASLLLDFGSTPYDGIADGEDLAFKYTDASGAQLGSIESTGFLDGSADAHREHLFGGVVTPAANAALVLHLLAGSIATGDSPLKVRVRYRVVSLLA